ncbi:MAG TPA: carbon-nitrogen hydrolase family protein [Opitutaceae bacterium]|nr:carbon-nitrogen hydrolase family protein [Opitutaceae bacterium]
MPRFSFFRLLVVFAAGLLTFWPMIEAAQVRVATCQFPVSAQVSENAEWILRQIAEAREKGADVVHFPETALSGYAGVDHASLETFSWDLQREQLQRILAAAAEHRVWVVLGATHRLSAPNKPHNSLYLISPQGVIVDRYDKRFCTNVDLVHYSPGDHFVTFDLNGVKCGLLICYDVRFPELYRQYAKQGVQLMFHSFYNARGSKDSIHPKIMPLTAQAHAASNGMTISLTNSSAAPSWEGRVVGPDGLVVTTLVRDVPGVIVTLVDTDRPYYDASRPFRAAAIDGKLNSGTVVDDPKSRDRNSY